MTFPDSPAGLLDRAGHLAPQRLGLLYTGGACIGTAVHLIGQRTHSPGLTHLGVAILGMTGLGLYIIVTWFRDDDAVAAGALLGLIYIIGSLAATVVAGAILTRSVTGVVGLLAFSPFVLLFQAAIIIPASGVLVWAARGVSAVIEQMLGTRGSRRDP
jgi:hypothetical protein